jgi:hypothetical protein
MYRGVIGSPPDGATPAARAAALIDRLTETITTNRTITVALVRALHGGKPDVARYVEEFGSTIQGMFLSAIAPDGPTERDRNAAAVLESVWFHAVVNWATNPAPTTDPSETMHRALGTLFEHRDETS